MATLESLITEFMHEARPIGTVVDDDVAMAQGIAALRYYAAYGMIKSILPAEGEGSAAPLPGGQNPAPDWLSGAILSIDPVPGGKFIPEPGKPLPPNPLASLSKDTELEACEWALIRPLFLLYLERENALHLESTRVMGADVYGRSSSEIAQDINAAELEMQHRAFIQPVISI